MSRRPASNLSAPPPATGSGLTIRPGISRDLDAIDAIENRSFAKDRFPRRNLARVLKSPAATFLFAEIDGRPAGYAMLLFRKGSRIARLYSIAVDPNFRGKGVADALLKACYPAATLRGAIRLRLELRPSNKPALRLYERAGFAPLERKSGYYDDGEDALRMERTLTAD